MTGWNFDITIIPRGSDLWVETAKGEVVRTRFVPKSKSVKEAYWLNVGAEDRIVAWQPYVVPKASGIGRRLPVNKQSFDFTHIIEDAGSGA